MGKGRVWVGSSWTLDPDPNFFADPDPDPKGLKKLDPDPDP